MIFRVVFVLNVRTLIFCFTEQQSKSKKSSISSKFDASEPNQSTASSISTICSETTLEKSDESDFLIPIIEKVVVRNNNESVNSSYSFNYSEIDLNVFDSSETNAAFSADIVHSSPVEPALATGDRLYPTASFSPIRSNRTEGGFINEVRDFDTSTQLQTNVSINIETNSSTSHIPNSEIITSPFVESNDIQNAQTCQNVGPPQHRVRAGPAKLSKQSNVDRTIARFREVVEKPSGNVQVIASCRSWTKKIVAHTACKK
uniref:Uncharacterized protein LOC114343358 n=1 Tax=Diabrotica virgifera virgifera TaxID=50390 RepID=A0A6P7GVD0_DIAVI